LGETNKKGRKTKKGGKKDKTRDKGRSVGVLDEEKDLFFILNEKMFQIKCYIAVNT
jgi:hypothetical protein